MNNYFVDLTTLFNIILTAVCALAGAVMFICCVAILNKVPAKWLCDYDEQPSEEMLNGVRYKGIFTYITGSVLTAISSALTYLVFGASLYTVLILALLFVLLLIIMADGKYYIIPDQFAVTAGIISLAFAYYDLFNMQITITSWWSPLVGGVGVALLIILVNVITMLITKKQGMGFGDVKLFLAVGIATGFPKVLIALLIAVLISFIIIVVTLIKNAVRKKETENYIPFGPSICIGVLACIILHAPIADLISLYLSLFII